MTRQNDNATVQFCAMKFLESITELIKVVSSESLYARYQAADKDHRLVSSLL